jgi:hypothetical protein
MEKNAVHRPDEEDEEDEIVIGPRTSGDPERRSVRSEDMDLLEGADAEAMSIRGSEGVTKVTQDSLSPTTGSGAGRLRSGSAASSKVLEFER